MPSTACPTARRSLLNERGCGQALIGRLLRACLDRGIEPRTSCRATQLIIEDGSVVGVVIETPEGPIEVRARRGVILASGGFEWNEEFKRAFLRGPTSHPVSMETNTGDGLRMAMQAGAALSNMREAWWIPVGEVPIESNPMGRVLVNGQRTLPHSIMINKRGRRFTNEAANYNAFGTAFHTEDVARFEYANQRNSDRQLLRSASRRTLQPLFRRRCAHIERPGARARSGSNDRSEQRYGEEPEHDLSPVSLPPNNP